MNGEKIEIEKRGKLTEKRKVKLLEYLKENGEFIGEYNQLSVFCESDNKYLGDIENTKVSISITTQKDLINNRIKCELKAKFGKMESGIRHETRIPFKFKVINQVFEFLKIFEVNTGCPRFYHRYDYRLGKYRIAIKEKGYAPDHFEIETVINNISKAESEEFGIVNFINSLGLKSYTNEEYKEIMLGTFRKYPPVDFEKIDFSAI